MLLVAFLHCLKQLARSPDDAHGAYDRFKNHARNCGNHIALHRPNIPDRRTMSIQSMCTLARTSPSADLSLASCNDDTSDEEPLSKRRKVATHLPALSKPADVGHSLPSCSKPQTVPFALVDTTIDTALIAARHRRYSEKPGKEHNTRASANRRRSSSELSSATETHISPRASRASPLLGRNNGSRYAPSNQETPRLVVPEAAGASLSLSSGNGTALDANHNSETPVSPCLTTDVAQSSNPR